MQTHLFTPSGLELNPSAVGSKQALILAGQGNV